MVEPAFHLQHGAQFGEVNGQQVVRTYGNLTAEYEALTKSVALLDLSFRGRVCLTGADRVRFLHGQVTNNIKSLATGSGCYTAIVNAKGKMEADANVYALESELLLDFEAGFTTAVTSRLEKYIVADDVQVVDVAALYGLLSLQGPAAESCVRKSGLFPAVPEQQFSVEKLTDAGSEDIYLARRSRVGVPGFEVFVPAAVFSEVANKFLKAVRAEGGGLSAWDALEIARVEAGIPRYGPDMDQTAFPAEAGIDAQAVSYSKGCYIGQEVLNRIHTMGHVNRTLRTLLFGPGVTALPQRGDTVLSGVKQVGQVTSAVQSVRSGRPMALAYVRSEAAASGTELVVRTADAEHPCTVS